MSQVKKVVIIVDNSNKTFESKEGGTATSGRVIIIYDSNHELKEKNKLLDRGYKEIRP